jgi:hypothetical protein
LTQKNPMAPLYHRLGSLGFSRKYLREVVLPDWWDDEIAHNSAGYAEGLTILSRNLALDLSSMQNPAVPVGLRNLGPCKFKKRPSTTEEELVLARILATRAVELDKPATPEPRVPFSKSASEIRQMILERGGPWINLPSLLNYCWAIAVPVLHISALPRATKKMEGLSVARGGGYGIVLGKNEKHSAWLLFILAHELGHITQGHVIHDGVLVDEAVDRKSRDQEETVANTFAIELLTGQPDTKVFTEGAKVSARGLYQAALEVGRHEYIDPGHIILNWANQKGGEDSFAVANAALRLLEPQADAIGLVRSKMLTHLDKTKLPEDTYEFVLKISGVGAEQ